MTDCIICAYPVDQIERIPALTICSHNESICSICFLRMRSLQRNFHCPSCKRELDHVICCGETGRRYDDFTIWGDTISSREDFVYDPLSQIFFPKEYHRQKVEPLRQLKCRICNQTRKDFKGLKGHYASEHNLHLCSLCIEHKQVFPAEQKVYTKVEYDRHIRHGDQDGSIGHPNCEFCRTRFYDSTALFHHLHREHYTCFICEKQGVKFRFFHQYTNLEEHFRKEHYLCEESSCLEQRFVAFANEIDLRSHLLSHHPHLCVSRTIPIHFNLRRPEMYNRDGTVEGVSGGGDYEGGLGGRAREGQWQLLIQPPAADPRDPDRNVNDDEDALPPPPSEDFPALPPSSAAPVLVNNRWVNTSVRPLGKGRGGNAGKGGSPAMDFPALPSSSTNSSSHGNVGKGPAKGNKNDAAGLVQQVTGLSVSANQYQQGNPSGSSLGDWAVNVKVDKRLQKRSSAPTSTMSRPASKAPVWSASGVVEEVDDFEVDLEEALHASLESYTHTMRNAAHVNPLRPDKLDDTSAYPSLAASSSNDAPVKGPASSVPPKKKTNAGGDWQSALKSVGMKVPASKKKGSGLTVIKAKDSTADLKLRPANGSGGNGSVKKASGPWTGAA